MTRRPARLVGPGGVGAVYVAPRSRIGRRALVLLLIVVTYPLYWSVLLLLPDSWRAVRIAVGVLIPLTALASLVLAGVAILRSKDRSVLLIGLAAIALVLVLTFAIGEFVVPG